MTEQGSMSGGHPRLATVTHLDTFRSRRRPVRRTPTPEQTALLNAYREKEMRIGHGNGAALVLVGIAGIIASIYMHSTDWAVPIGVVLFLGAFCMAACREARSTPQRTPRSKGRGSV